MLANVLLFETVDYGDAKTFEEVLSALFLAFTVIDQFKYLNCPLHDLHKQISYQTFFKKCLQSSSSLQEGSLFLLETALSSNILFLPQNAD